MNYTEYEVILMKDGTIKAVYDSDLEELLKSLNVLSDVMDGKCQCYFCQKTITLENIDGIIPKNRSVVFSCNEQDCHFKLVNGVSFK